jgi:hypothetical protein
MPSFTGEGAVCGDGDEGFLKGIAGPRGGQAEMMNDHNSGACRRYC